MNQDEILIDDDFLGDEFGEEAADTAENAFDDTEKVTEEIEKVAAADVEE